MAVHITGTMGLPSGAVYPNCEMYFERKVGVVSQEGHAVVPEKTIVRSNASAAVDFYLLYGEYIGTIQTTLGVVKFAFSVLDVASATFISCIGDVGVPIPADSVQVALDAAAEAAASALSAVSSASALTAQNRLAAVDLATTANVTLSGSQTVDGVASATKRILVKDQTVASQNGIYNAAAGSWTRATDANTAIELAYAYVAVIGGSTNAGKHFQSINAPTTLGSDPVMFSRLGEVADVVAETAARIAADLEMTTSTTFTAASIDPYGYVLRIEWAEGDVFSPIIESVSGVISSLDWADVDADGYILPGRMQWGDGTSWPAVYAPQDQMALGDLLIKVGYGQSVSGGPGEGGLSVVAISGLNMFADGDWLDDTGWSAPPAFNSVVSHVAVAGREPWGRGSAEAQAQFYSALEGYDIKSVGGVLSINASRGEQSALELSSGGAYFGRLGLFLTAAAAYSVTTGRAATVGPLPFVHGEADISIGTSGMGYFEQVENGIRAPYEAVVQSIIDPSYKCMMLMTQVASATYYDRTNSDIALMQLRMCMERPDRYAFAGAMYQYDYGGLGGAGSHLNGAVENKWAAAMMGRAEAYAIAGRDVPFIKPISASKRGSRAVMVSFEAPNLPLVLDNTAVTDPGNFGFKLFRVDTGAEVAITTVAVVGNSSVKITTTAGLPAAEIRVAYAQHGGAYDDGDGDPFGSSAGRLTGNRGCLRDSTPDTFVIGAATKPLWHWTPIFELTTGA